jgi:hypothetical protein
VNRVRLYRELKSVEGGVMLMLRHHRGWRRCFVGGVARERRPSGIAGPPGAGDRHSRRRSRVHAARGGSPPPERKSGEGRDRRGRELEQSGCRLAWDRRSVVAKRVRTGSRRDARCRQRSDHLASHEPGLGGRRRRSPHQGSDAGRDAGPHASAKAHANTDAQTCRDAHRGPDTGTYRGPDTGTYRSPNTGTYRGPDADGHADTEAHADTDAHTQTDEVAQTYGDTDRRADADGHADADRHADANADANADRHADTHTQTDEVAQTIDDGRRVDVVRVPAAHRVHLGPRSSTEHAPRP